MMPKLDGISVLKELKQDSALRFTPIILVTAKADTRDVVNGLEAGGDDYLTKPFEHAALVARVRSLLRTKDLHDTVQSQAAQLKEQTEQLSSWNRLLEERVAEQLAQIERIGRLQRFLAPQVAQMIASSDAPDSLLASHRREVTVLFCDLRIHRSPSIGARRGHGVCASITRAWASSSSNTRARWAIPRRRHHDRLKILSLATITPSVPVAWRSTCARSGRVGEAVGQKGHALGFGSASLRGTRRSVKSVSSIGANIRRSAAS
jgi:DNA-binding NarL/FixJ family response regulator